MKRIITVLTITVLSSLFFSPNTSIAQNKVDWKSFSKNLVMAIKTPNTGLQVSAMQLIITYAEKLDVSDATLDLVRLYRTHKNERVRQIALVTINEINNDWATGIVKRDYAFEKSQSIKKMMAAIIVQNQKKMQYN